MEIFFNRLATRMGAFHVFMLGAVVYAIVAALTWIASLLLTTREHPLQASRRRTN